MTLTVELAATLIERRRQMRELFDGRLSATRYEERIGRYREIVRARMKAQKLNALEAAMACAKEVSGMGPYGANWLLCAGLEEMESQR